jgi:inorganic pyrophosphatase
MKYTATIEIPKNSPRRIHKGNQPENMGKFMDFGPISDKITANGGLMPLAYGFIENTTGSDGEGDEVDVMVFSNKDLKTEDSTEITPFAMMMREDGDYKVLAHDETVQINSWEEVPEDMKKILMDFNGFKLPIVAVKNTDDTIAYIESVKKA